MKFLLAELRRFPLQTRFLTTDFAFSQQRLEHANRRLIKLALAEGYVAHNGDLYGTQQGDTKSCLLCACLKTPCIGLCSRPKTLCGQNMLEHASNTYSASVTAAFKLFLRPRAC